MGKILNFENTNVFEIQNTYFVFITIILESILKYKCIFATFMYFYFVFYIFNFANVFSVQNTFANYIFRNFFGDTHKST